ncbi:MAG: hypothetical protein ACFB12_27210 [Leptolyngbyaceae cyanobacterium]
MRERYRLWLLAEATNAFLSLGVARSRREPLPLSERYGFQISSDDTATTLGLTA